jgi:starch synthase
VPSLELIVAVNTLVVTSEAFPLAKTGGLGDAVSGMASALARAGGHVTVLLPAYRGTIEQLSDAKVICKLDDLPGGAGNLVLGHLDALGVPVLLLQNDALYDRENLYVDENGNEYQDNPVRFAALAHAATRIAAGDTPIARPDIVHAMDWHAALTPMLMRQAGITDVKSVLTIHNLAFQGIYPMHIAPSLHIDARYLGVDGAEFWGQINFMKAGLQFADRITAVSRTYAREILTPEFGCALEGVVRSRVDELVAIPNGIDAEIWNPQHDAHLPHRRFSAAHMGNKAACKRDLQAAFGLAQDPEALLIVMGSRLTTQKMADLAAQALPLALEKHPQLQTIVMGKGDKGLEQALRASAARFPGRFGLHIGFDEKQAHLLHAGGDVLLHGSRFEPFGLTPIYAMRYGTLPIGSKTGGMADTIVDAGPDAAISAMRQATGFLFEGDTLEAMSAAIERAVEMRAHPGTWRAMQHNGMTADFSWARCAPLYNSLYRELVPAPIKLSPAPDLVAVQPDMRAASAASFAQLPALRPSRAIAARPKKMRRGDRGGDLLLPSVA